MKVYSVSLVAQIPEEWIDYAQVACLVMALALCILHFFKFRSNLKLALTLIAITLALWSANIYFTCCNMHNNSECYFLIGFITLEDLLTIIFCVLIKRLKKTVVTVLLSMSTAFLITGVVLFFVDRNNHLLSELAGGFWNTSVAILALLYASFLK
uniref:Uncharacterized protein n=1 Tax=Trichobilharzia regenti TaxID=157069 RepID=A0AA85IYD0_TRIRE|nr:unnamed protein product [Trichobilharzia regenti]